MATINGHCDERFRAVRDTMAGNLDSGADVGSSVAVYLDGELVVDLWGGTTTDLDGNDGEWQENTLVNVFSTTKTMCNLSALLLADRGEIDLDAPVATYWPEFKANGKDNVLVRHLLEPHRRLVGLGRADDGERPLRLGQVLRVARGAGAVVDARRRGRATTRDAGLPRR